MFLNRQLLIGLREAKRALIRWRSSAVASRSVSSVASAIVHAFPSIYGWRVASRRVARCARRTPDLPHSVCTARRWFFFRAFLLAHSSALSATT